MLSSRHRALLGILCVCLTLLPCSFVLPGEAEQPDGDGSTRGQELYQMYCSSCHGLRGQGDGPTARSLKILPPDLTRLAKRNKGEFPAERVYNIIDGRQAIASHGKRRMPIWGLAFQEYDRDTNQEAGVRFRIKRLVEYLQSIQD